MRDVREQLLAYALAKQKHKFASGHVPCGPKSVDEAIENLNRFAVVGIFEKLPRFAIRFDTALGRKLKILYENASPRNQLKQQRLSDPKLVDRIAELCEPDRQVYQRVAKRVAADCEVFVS